MGGAASVPVAPTESKSWFAVTRTQRACLPACSVLTPLPLSPPETVPTSVKPESAPVVDTANVTAGTGPLSSFARSAA